MNQLTRHPLADISQEALWQLLRTQARKYAQGDHGSLPVEVMEKLLASILYTLGQAPDAGVPLEQRLMLGQEQLRQKLRHAQVLLARVRVSALPPGNQSYGDTLRVLPDFFARYDALFFAHQVPVDIDYQLFLPQFGGEGIDAFTAYLEALLVENRFCGRFSAEVLRSLWAAASPDWRGLHINLYEPVFTGALGIVLLGDNPRRLLFTRQEQEAIVKALQGLSIEEMPETLSAAAEKLLLELGLKDVDTAAYVGQSAMALLPRLLEARGQGTLAYVFHAGKKEGLEAEDWFVDGPRLPDGAMRRLVLTIRDLQNMDEKLALLQREVSSLRDLGDLLSGCFWGDEMEAVFALLTEPEAQALSGLYPGEDSPDWVEMLRVRQNKGE